MTAAIAVVVIPTYNERENVRPLAEKLERVRASLLPDLETHLLFVDDGSPDGTGDLVQELSAELPFVHLLRRAGKMGIGTAYIEGFRRAASELDPSFFVQIDADLQHPPEKIVELLEAVRGGGADMALASRYVRGGGIKGWSRSRRVISRGANWIAETILGLGVEDVTTGYKAMNRRAADLLTGSKVSSAGFSYQVESVFLLKRNGMKIVEVPFTFEERVRGTSKLSRSEMLQFLKSILALRFR